MGEGSLREDASLASCKALAFDGKVEHDYSSYSSFADDITSSITSYPASPSIPVVASTVYYSYMSGPWDDPKTWTQDPSGTTQVGATIPSDNASVVILSNRRVALPADITSKGLSITVNDGGILDLGTYKFTNTLATLAGDGEIRIASAYFPLVTTNSFVLAGGGTTEFYNSTSFTLPSNQAIYNNLNIYTSSSVVVTQLSDLTINGSLTILGGTFQINDNSSKAQRKLTILGDVTVNSGTKLTVGTGSTNSDISTDVATTSSSKLPFIDYYEKFHRVVIYGNFYNYGGTVKFTNLVNPAYGSFPPVNTSTSGAATVYFMGGSNTSLVCNGVTNFYNLVVDKLDPSISLTIDPSLPKNFVLFGANVAPFDLVNTDAANPNVKKAFWMRTGTVILKGATAIPSLTEGSTANSDYFIPRKATLVLNGPDVVVLSTTDSYAEVNITNGTSVTSNDALGITTSNSSSLALIGSVVVNDGYLSTRESAGITYWSYGSGQLEINGGLVDTKQLQDGSGSNSGVISYVQNGGTMVLRGRFQHDIKASKVDDLTLTGISNVRSYNGVSTGMASFYINGNASSGFSMGGGEIRVLDGCTKSAAGAFAVACPTSNINVTGGTLAISPQLGSLAAEDNTYLEVNSSAPISNLVVSRLSGSCVVRLVSNNLYVINNISVLSGVLDANGKDLFTAGDFTIANGSSYLATSSRTVFNGRKNQVFTINTDAPQSLYRLKILKDQASSELSFAGSQKTVNITDSLSIVTGKLNDNGVTINASGGIYNSGAHYGAGVIALVGTSAQGIDGDGSGVFTNLTLKSTASINAPITTSADFTINGNLKFLSDKSLSIGSNNLTFAASSTIEGAGTGNRYIITSGKAGDGGVTMFYTAQKLSRTFFVGAPSTNRTSAAYTPATIGFSSAPSSLGSITVTPVGYEHPAASVSNRSLTYFWHVKSSGFPASLSGVTHTFVYNANDVQGTGANYVSACYNRNTYKWNYGVAVLSNQTIVDWSNSGALLDGDYTAGYAAFDTPKVFYSCINGSGSGSGSWSQSTNWSFNSNAGPADTQGLVPSQNDIVVIGGKDSVYLGTDLIDLNEDVRSCASLQIEKGSALDIGYNPGCIFSMVINHPNGNGNFRLTTSSNSGSVFAFPKGDFSDYNVNKGTTEFYTTNGGSGTIFILPSNVNSYGNLILTPKGTANGGGSNLIMPNTPTVTIYGDLYSRGVTLRSWNTMSWDDYRYWPVVAKTVHVKGSLVVQGSSFGWYNNGSVAQNLIVDKDIVITSLGGIDDWGGANNQSITIGGSLINNTSGVVQNTSTSWCRLANIPITFVGESDAKITGTVLTSGNSPSTIFGLVTINKGSSPSTTLTCDIGGTITTPNDGWLTLQNGSFLYKSPSDLNITTTSPFSIPSTAALDINTSSTVYIAQGNTSSNTVSLGGKLAIEQGVVNVGKTTNTGASNSIEYASGGYSAIAISGGTLNVNGQIRRNPLNAAGILQYSQSGGIVNLYGNKATNGINATLEVLNDGSLFSMSGSSALNIINGGGGTNTFGDLYLRPGSGSVTGGTITFGNRTSETFAMDASIPLYSLVVNGRNGDNTLNLMVNPLVLNGSLTLSNSTSILKANNVNVSLKGDFINNGTTDSYVFGTNTTTLNGNIQNITGTSATNFYHLTINPITSVTLNKGFTVNGDLSILSGTMVCGSNKVVLMGDFTNNGTFTDSNGGVSLEGTVAQQQLGGSGTFGNLNLNNTLGARLFSSINLNSNLTMTKGILDINKYLLTLGLNCTIVASGTAFSATKMVISDGVYSDVGIKKFINIGAVKFTFPIGSGSKYTPAVLDVSANKSAGYVRVNNINSKHPSILKFKNYLKYYWEAQSDGISGFTGSLLFTYDKNDAVGTPSTFEASRLSIPAYTWSKSQAPNDNVNESNNTITFTFPSNSSSVSGEYTAANDDELPAVIAAYTSIKNGDWSDKTIWSPTAPDGGPNGYIVTIDKNTVVTANSDYTFAYRTNIVDGGVLKIDPTKFGHNLGTVTGSGTLHLENGVMPAGRYDAFFDCSSNATLEYGGSGSYTIVADLFTTLPNLSVTGTGTRYYPNADLTVCKKLEINGPTLDNSLYDRKLTILGKMLLTSGGFRAGVGDDATVAFSGTQRQNISTDLNSFTGDNKFNNIVINNSAGLDLTGKLELGGILYLTNGVVNTSSVNTFTITNLSESCISPAGGTTSSYINGPLTKYMKTGDYDFVFPVGQNRYGYQIALKATFSNSVPWTVQYFNDNPTSTSFNSPIMVVNSDEYWTVSTTDGTSRGYVKLYWNGSSGLTPAMTNNGIVDMRIADLESGKWTALATNSSGDNNNGYVTNAGSYNFSSANQPYSFTSASVTGIVPKAKFAPTGPICGSSSIPVTFYTNGMTLASPFQLTYSLDGVNSTVTFTSLDGYSLPVNVAGVYKLVAFKYNNGLGSGVVDAQTAVAGYATPTVANAGPDQSLCGATSAALTGNSPLVGSGLWSIVSGTGGTVVSPTDNSTSITGVNGSSYTARWTISNGGCASSDDVNIYFTLKPNSPTVTSPQAFCSGATIGNIAANAGSGASIIWYDAATGGSVLTSSTTITGGKTYYAEASNGCTSDSRSPVVANITPNVTVSPIVVYDGVEPTCLLTGTTSTTYSTTIANQTSYTWSLDNPSLGSINALTGAVVWNANVVGSTNVIITATGCGPAATTSRTITINALPSPKLKVMAPICAGSSTQLELTSAYSSYLWSVTTSGYSISNTTDAKPMLYSPSNTVLFPSNTTALVSYPDVKVVVTDSNGCSNSVQNTASNEYIKINRIPITGPPFHISNTIVK